jgi:hypothetical protein
MDARWKDEGRIRLSKDRLEISTPEKISKHWLVLGGAEGAGMRSAYACRLVLDLGRPTTTVLHSTPYGSYCKEY